MYVRIEIYLYRWKTLSCSIINKHDAYLQEKVGQFSSVASIGPTITYSKSASLYV